MSMSVKLQLQAHTFLTQPRKYPTISLFFILFKNPKQGSVRLGLSFRKDGLLDDKIPKEIFEDKSCRESP